MNRQKPSAEDWLSEAKTAENADLCGMYLLHNGTVRRTARSAVREGADNTSPVAGMIFDYDADKVKKAVAETEALPGIYHVRVWLNRGRLEPGEDIMQVLIGGDIRPRVVEALEYLVGAIKSRCVTEQEIF